MAYFDKHVQPSSDSCVGSLLANVFFLINLEKNVWIMGVIKFMENYWICSSNWRHTTCSF
jgi:hypothetical protein